MTAERQKSIEKLVKNLPSLRAVAGLSQKDLAEMIGVSRQTIVYIENGKRKMSWTLFLALMFIFTRRRDTKQLIEIMGIYPKEAYR